MTLIGQADETGSEFDRKKNMSAVANATDLQSELRSRFSRFQSENLTHISAEAFQSNLMQRLGQIDAEVEGYTPDELERQRDLSIKYVWGHNHDFGRFRLDGRMGDRHFELMLDFVENFPVEISNFDDADVFDIGCWTGGTTLLLNALGGRVLAIEEVRKYAQTVNFLVDSFGIGDAVGCESKSLYECRGAEFENRFDIAYFPGVIYHLSDPVLALRILFNSLKTDGEILVESAGIDAPEPICRFEGNYIYRNGTREELNRGGWNWFLPSATALERMLIEAGFEATQTFFKPETNRVYGYGKKTKFVGICKAGLSVPEIL